MAGNDGVSARRADDITAYDLFTNRLVRISLRGPTELAIDAYGVKRRAVR